MKQNRKWKISHPVLGRNKISKNKNRKLKVKL